MECEWNPVHRKDRKKVPFSGIKYDFQKLLLANANVRLMVFKFQKSEHLNDLYSYFYKNIKGYKHLPKGAYFFSLPFRMIKGLFSIAI